MYIKFALFFHVFIAEAIVVMVCGRQGSRIRSVRRDGHGSGRVGWDRAGSGQNFRQIWRVGSGRVGSKYLKCIIFSLSVELSKFSFSCNSQH